MRVSDAQHVDEGAARADVRRASLRLRESPRRKSEVASDLARHVGLIGIATVGGNDVECLPTADPCQCHR